MTQGIGGRAVRLDAWDKVTGRAQYPADLRFENALVAGVLRSPHPHAIVRRIDLAPALAVPGVVAAVCGSDVPGTNRYGLIVLDQPVLARPGDRVRYVGDAVAAVAAETRAALDAALASIQVDYEILPGVFDVFEARAPGAPRLHAERPGNILHRCRLERGNVRDGWDRSDVIVEGTYDTPFVDHAYLQPEAGVAQVGQDGRVSVWVATQSPYTDRHEIACALGLSDEAVRVIQTTTGGAFGGREDISVQIVLALVALKTGRPVRWVYSRAESLTASTKRHPFHMRYRTGATRDGRLTAMDIELVSNAGAYASTSASVLETAVTLATGCYEVPNVSIEAEAVYTNCPPAAAMRGFGANQPAFASEMQMNKLAERLSMDPVELRRRNLYRNGSLMHTGQVLEAGVGVRRCLEAVVTKASELGTWPPVMPETGARPRASDATGRAAPSGSKRRGVGVACGFKNVGFNLGFDDRSEAIVEAYPDHALVKVGASEVGQGSTTVLAQLAATVLELPLEAIHMVVSDTDRVPDGGSSSASRQTYVSGRAVLQAASEAAHRLAALGANPPRDVLPVVARVTCHAPSTFPMEPGTGQSQRPNFSYGYGAQVVEVEVDIETGAVHVLRVVAAHDVGRAINLSAVEGQIEGGLVMAQGYSLMEEYQLERGIPRSTSLATFLIPTSVDAPAEIVPLVVEEPDPEGPLGAKGVGEMTMLPTPGAIAAAIHDATGVWVDRLPITPERLLRAMGRLGPATGPNKDDAPGT